MVVAKEKTGTSTTRPKRTLTTGEDVIQNKVAHVGDAAGFPGDGSLADGSQETANEQTENQVSVVVTPQKPSAQTKATGKWFVLNIQCGECHAFATRPAADNFKAMLVKANSNLVDRLMIDEFENKSAAIDFLALCHRMGVREIPPNDDDPPDALQACTKPPAIQIVNVAHGELSADPLLDDDDIPFEARPADGSSEATGISSDSPQMRAFEAASIGTGTSIEVMRWRLPQCTWDVYAFQLMDGKEQYWSHKPQMWMTAVETEKTTPIFSVGSPHTLHKALNKCNCAPMRAVPFGENMIKQIKTKKNSKMIDQFILYGFVRPSYTNDQIGEMIHKFVDACKMSEIRKAYHLTITGKMPSPAISEDCKPNGKYWIKLASGANNTSFKMMRALSEVFMDLDIVQIINLLYGTKGALSRDWKPESRDWKPEIRTAAFGSASG